MHGVTKVLVLSTVHSLNEKLERLGWVRRYEFIPGSNPNGVKHVLQTIVPHLNQPTDLQRFATYARAHRYLEAMGQVLNDAIAERERERTMVMSGMEARERVLLPTRGTFADPDARSKRPGE